MAGEYYVMSGKRLALIEVIEKIAARRLSQVAGAKQLGMSTRHLRRLQRQYHAMGTSSLQSKRIGRPSNHQISDTVKEKVLLIMKEHYADFGPTLAHEKLTEQHGFTFSVEWLRQLMISNQLWQGKKAKKTAIHQSRPRRAAFGELVQIDGSPHDWFEGRAPRCCLIVFVDDATSRIMALHFAEQETTQAYFQACRQHLAEHGRPVSYYSDKFGVFRINQKEAKTGTGETQFGRAMRELGIELICANSPQAKGRVEKMNGTLQDRLIKEMRLSNISDIPTANAFLPEFITDYNQRFAKAAASPEDAHRQAVPEADTLSLIFSEQHQRKLSKNLQLSYHNVIYQIQTKQPSYAMRGAVVTVCEGQSGVTLLYKQSALSYTTIDKHNQPAPVIPRKQALSTHRKTTPKADHPWRKAYKPSRATTTAMAA